LTAQGEQLPVESIAQIGEDELLGAMSVVPLDDVAAREAARLHSVLIDANNEIG